MAHIVKRDVGAALAQSTDAGGSDQGLCRAWACTPANVFADFVRREIGPRMRREHEPHGIVTNRVGDDDFIEHFTQRENAIRIEQFFQLDGTPQNCPQNDVVEFLAAQEGDLDFEQKPVELRLGKGVRAFLLDRVLRGHHKERLFELVDRAGRRHGTFLHRLEQCRLRFRRGAVDLVGQEQLREDGSRSELEFVAPFGIGGHDPRADDVGRHQVGRELNAPEVELQYPRQGLD